jgi:putative oxygen-independent coproporphyrinogen III oxidase
MPSSSILLKGERADGPPTPDVAHLMRPGTLKLPVLPPLALYIHFPWCVRKCPYCDFNSHEVDAAGIPEADYIAALRADLEAAVPLVWSRPVISIFIGGGTPSLLSAGGVARVLSDARALLPVAADCEITLEANPGTFEAERFAAYRAAGVNRLSIGVQSFEPAKLIALGRIHDRDQALAAIDVAQRHYDNFNLDLMFALPGQSFAELQADVEQALACCPPHLSLYPPSLPTPDEAATMHDWITTRVSESGYRHYEVSAYARPGHACRHNLNYWTFGDYIGIGAGAHSKISFPHRVLRQVRYRSPSSYLQHGARGRWLAESHEVSRAELPFEFMLNTLRLNEGFPSQLFADRTGMPISSIEAPLQAAEQRGLIERDQASIRPTALGRAFLSDLQSLFLAPLRT